MSGEFIRASVWGTGRVMISAVALTKRAVTGMAVRPGVWPLPTGPNFWLWCHGGPFVFGGEHSKGTPFLEGKRLLINRMSEGRAFG